MLKISIITVCYNSADTIESTIKSVVSQDHPNVEYIIVDGGSKDNTLHLLEKYRSSFAKCISEKDEGIYDALNKGLALATGDVIGILHADDFYDSPSVLSDVMQLFTEKQVDCVYGDLQYVDRVKTSLIKRNWVSGHYKKENFLKGWMPPHPSFFAARHCYEKFGNFNTQLKTAADYELMLRFLFKHNCSVAYIPKVLVKMRVGGKSNVSILNRVKANREDKRAWMMNGLTPGMFTFIRKPLSKISQFFHNKM